MDFFSLNFKMLTSFLASGLTFLAFIPYIRSILNGETKPHVFSWVIWALTTLIVFAAQVVAGGGWGAWPIGLSGVITFGIGVLAYYKKSDVHIVMLDWVFLILALGAIPLWMITDNPMWAVIILTTIDMIGFLPTIRKAYIKPFEEQLLMYVMITFRNILVMLALSEYSVTTWLFPVATTLGGFVLMGIIAYRRRIV